MKVEYRGVVFDNVEHARWAMFLELCGVDWSYKETSIGLSALLEYSVGKFMDAHRSMRHGYTVLAVDKKFLDGLARRYEPFNRKMVMFTPDFWLGDLNRYLVVLLDGDGSFSVVNASVRLANQVGVTVGLVEAIDKDFDGIVKLLTQSPFLDWREQGICNWDSAPVHESQELIHDYTKLAMLAKFTRVPQ